MGERSKFKGGRPPCRGEGRQLPGARGCMKTTLAAWFPGSVAETPALGVGGRGGLISYHAVMRSRLPLHFPGSQSLTLPEATSCLQADF